MADLPSRRNTLAATIGAAAFLPQPTRAQGVQAPGGAVFDVKRFGATGRRNDKATAALQAAIDAAAAAGGGVAYVSPGEYTCGPVSIKSNVEVRLDAGATIFVSRDPADFTPAAGGPRLRALFNANKVENIAITGKGRIDGQATWEWRLPPENDYTTRHIATEVDLARKAGLDMRFWHKTGQLANIVGINGATNVLIEDITTINSSSWCMRLAECDRLFIRGVHLFSDLDRAVNSDGIDLVSSRNVVISDCVLTTADDCISLKSMRAGSGVENVTVTNCVLTSSSSAFAIGAETWHDIRHVVFSNSVIRNANRGIRIVNWNGCTISDVIFSNLTMDLSRRHYNWWGHAEAFQFVIGKENPDSALGRVRNVIVENIIAHARGTSALIAPAGERLMEDISISNVQMTMSPENTADKRASHALSVEGVRGFRLRDFSVKWDEEQTEPKWGSGLYLKDVDDFEVVGFRGRQGLKNGNASAIALNNVTGGVIRNSRATTDTETFLEVCGTRTKNVAVFHNDASKAANKYRFANGATRESVSFAAPSD
jgi:polygalacturonase